MKCKNCVYYVHMNDDGERTIGTPNWCFHISDSPDEELERDCIKFKFLTNADRIRAMTDEELTDLFISVGDGSTPEKMVFSARDMKFEQQMWLRWLQREVDDEW